jgi:hypothetical protein
MKTKIGMSFGLAMMLAVGVFATLLALGTFTPSEVQAKVSPVSDVNFSDVQVYPNVGGPSDDDLPTVDVSPDEPGAVSRHTIIFTAPSDLLTGLDTITIQFEDDVGVPEVLDPATISIIASHGTNRAAGVTGTVTGTMVANPISVSTEKVGVPADETEITLMLPDMATGEDGNQGILGDGGRGWSVVTVVINQTAGLTNPTEGTKDYGVKVKTNKNGTFVSSEKYNIPRELILSNGSANRGRTITVTGRGFENGTTATVWLDLRRDGILGTEDGILDTEKETVLGQAIVQSDDTFTVSFVVNVPPFVRGIKNHIRAKDGQSPPNVDEGDGPFFSPATFFVDGLLKLTPKEVAIGDTVVATIKDWPGDDGQKVTTFAVGGVPIPVTFTIVDGQADFSFEVPDGVTLGVQEVKLKTSYETDTVDITVLGAGLDVAPGVVVPNQTVTLQGRGFTDDGVVTIANDGKASSVLTIGGVLIKEENFDEGDIVTVDSSGNWVASVVIPINSVTVEPGTYDLKAFDSEGREGVTTITLRGREIQVTPPVSRSGTDITVTGSGYPAVNSTSPQDISVTVRYSGSGFSPRTVTATPDSSGNFSAVIGVPLGAGIPSTNTLTITYTYTDPVGRGLPVPVVDTLSHRIPGAEISIDPVMGQAGTVVTVMGSGFKGTRQLSNLEIGNVDVRNIPVPATDREGNFETTFVVPQLETGAQSVQAEVGGDTSGTTASASFTVLKTGASATSGPASAAQDTGVALASIIDNSDNLVRVFRFNNETQGWSFFDPRPAFANANDLTTVAGGDILWIRVKLAQDFNELSLFSGWNLIVMP